MRFEAKLFVRWGFAFERNWNNAQRCYLKLADYQEKHHGCYACNCECGTSAILVVSGQRNYDADNDECRGKRNRPWEDHAKDSVAIVDVDFDYCVTPRGNHRTNE